jgi:glycosyltransferase involved in cell wall biosynthesis
VKVLSFTSLYPSASNPTHGVFVENRLRHLAATGRVELRVVAPVPWTPPLVGRLARYRAFAATPAVEERHGIPVAHPRYPSIPRIGMAVAPFLMYGWTVRALRAEIASGFDFDLIDSHYFYPDGVAAALLARHFGRPFVVTARGSDVNVIAGYRLPRRMMLWAASRAARVVTVSRALKDSLTSLGIPPRQVEVMRNGVDLATFHPGDRAAQRRALALDGPALVSVGSLLEFKGHGLVIESLARLPGVNLLIVGDGPERAALEALARRAGVADRVRFLGRVAHESLAAIYGAADALVLASAREGWPNVLLEAMACGTPSIATRVGGTPEIVTAKASGRLLPARSPEAIAAAVTELLAAPPDRAATRAYAERFGWDETTNRQLELFEKIVVGIQARPAMSRA